MNHVFSWHCIQWPVDHKGQVGMSNWVLYIYIILCVTSLWEKSMHHDSYAMHDAAIVCKVMTCNRLALCGVIEGVM